MRIRLGTCENISYSDMGIKGIYITYIIWFYDVMKRQSQPSVPLWELITLTVPGVYNSLFCCIFMLVWRVLVWHWSLWPKWMTEIKPNQIVWSSFNRDSWQNFIDYSHHNRFSSHSPVSYYLTCDRIHL